MNPSPRLHWQGFRGDPTHNPGCGHTSMMNRARYFWQSRHNLRDPPELTDLCALAKQIRTTHPRS